jgi:NodT family efflux transporter outer membrane factor (OMF) lipoprotein
MNHPPRKRIAARCIGKAPLTAAILMGALLSGCASIPKDQRQLHPRAAAELGLSAPSAAAMAPDWWHALGDPQLDRITADALAGNPSLDEATARLRIAQALIGNFKAGLLPQASAGVSATDQRFSDKYIYPAPLGGSWSWVSNAQVDLSWSLDLAGRQHAILRAVKAFAGADELQTAATRVSLSGAVAQAYVNLARAEAQAKLAQDFVASREASLKLVENRRAAHLATAQDSAAAQTLLAEARQALVRAEGARALMVHALAALAGRGPDYYTTIAPTHLRFDAALPVPDALPADLLGRRADLLALRQQVEVATAGQSIAKADFYPDVNLQAFVGAQALGIGSLFTGKALTGGFGPALHLPIFSGGAISARYKASIAGADLAIAQYNGAVVKAVKEAADALSQVETNRADAAQQVEVVAGLQKTVELDQVRLSSGLGTRFDLLNSGERLLAARQAQVDLAADGALARVQLLVALGGGFTPIPTR